MVTDSASSRSALRALAIVLLAAATGAPAQSWIPNERQVSAEKELIDPEFSQARGQIAWVDGSGRLWLANVNRDTGEFEPPDGRGLLIDPDAAALGETVFAFNGPEWVLARGGDQITYTKFRPDRPPSARSARIAIAKQDRSGAWTYSFLSPNQPRYIPFGSEDPDDRAPRIAYLDSNGRHYWRETGSRNTEVPIPAVTTPFIPLRHVRGARAILFPKTVDGVQQVFSYDLDTQGAEQLTFDAGDKVAPWMWRAPEFGNEFVMTTVADGAMRVYRKLPSDSGAPAWTVVREVPPPPGGLMQSPEPFVYAGRSYMFMGMSISPNLFSSEIWIASIDPAQPVFKRISENTPLRSRGDPEFFVTNQGPRIYFSRYLLTDGPDPGSCPTRECSEGVWVSDPGLPGSP
jgi:hypothetical protein